MAAKPIEGPLPLKEPPQKAPQKAPLHPLQEPERMGLVEEEPATDSHAPANADPDDVSEKGIAQLGHNAAEVRDLGWNEPPDDEPSPLVGGLPNQELRTLIRRFNKQMYHVKALPEAPIINLDLNIADEEEFSPDKLRAHVERLYMTVIVGFVQFGKHIARLRSWREENRSIAFASVKSTTKGGVDTMPGTDRLKAAAGVEHAKNRIGVVKYEPQEVGGPVDFHARYRGKKGRLYITATATSPAISWTSAKQDIDPVFSIAIADIQEIKKVGGLGWKTKLVVGWSTNREIADGIIIVDKEGNRKQLTAIALREELFNRLVAMGNHMWESW